MTTNTNAAPDLKTIINFLMGDGPLNGFQFGETPEGAGKYWWRAELRRAALSTAAQPLTQDEKEKPMQSEVMKFDPATGEPRPYPSHAEQWRKWHGHSCAWLFNPWTGGRRDARDVGSDTNGRLIAPPGTLGSDLGVKTVPDNTANNQGNRTSPSG